jgi:diaminopimelate epimerase
VRFVHEQGLTAKREIRVETMSGVIVPRLEDDGTVTVDMGVPVFAPAQIPFISASDDVVQTLRIADDAIAITAVGMGNPHAVQLVADVDTAAVERQGPLIESHPRFPQRVNAGFMQVSTDRRHSPAGFRTWCRRNPGLRHRRLALPWSPASPAACSIRRCASKRVAAMLSIAWNGPGTPVLMTGPAVTVFKGEIEL